MPPHVAAIVSQMPYMAPDQITAALGAVQSPDAAAANAATNAAALPAPPTPDITRVAGPQ
jgi:hypothetical protein